MGRSNIGIHLRPSPVSRPERVSQEKCLKPRCPGSPITMTHAGPRRIVFSLAQSRRGRRLPISPCGSRGVCKIAAVCSPSEISGISVVAGVTGHTGFETSSFEDGEGPGGAACGPWRRPLPHIDRASDPSTREAGAITRLSSAPASRRTTTRAHFRRSPRQSRRSFGLGAVD